MKTKLKILQRTADGKQAYKAAHVLASGGIRGERTAADIWQAAWQQSENQRRVERAHRKMMESHLRELAEANARLERERAEDHRLVAAAQARELRLRQVLWRLTDAYETERKRMARELHDGMSQTLVLATLRLHEMASELPPQRSPEIAQVRQVRDLVKKSLDQVRCLSN